MSDVTRRTFLAAPTAAAVKRGRIIGANDRIQIGCIGVGMNGSRIMEMLVRQSAESGAAVEVAAVSDIYQKRKDWARQAARLPEKSIHHDYRELIARSDLDAVFIAVPDHWHAQMAIHAMAAGKDVYLQKPMTLTIEEAREITEAAERYGRIVQVGSQHLSDRRYHIARDLIAAGEIGTLLWAQSTYSRNSIEGEWNYFIEPEASPDAIDWTRWLGPAAKRPFSAERFFRWRKYWDYSGGIATDLFYHRLGPLLFAMGPQFPERVSASGGIYAHKDREVPDTYSTVIEYPNFYVSLSGSMANAAAQKYLPPVIYGQKGSIVIEDKQVRLVPEPIHAKDRAGKSFPVEQAELNRAHADNFFGCMRTRKKPIFHADFGYQVMSAIRLGVDSYRQRRFKFFDPRLRREIDRTGTRPAYQGDGTNHPKARRL